VHPPTNPESRFRCARSQPSQPNLLSHLTPATFSWSLMGKHYSSDLLLHLRSPNIDSGFIIDIRCPKQPSKQVFALTETVYEEQIVISANIEPLRKKEIPKQDYEILDVGCGWRKRGTIGVDYLKRAYGHEFMLDVQASAEHLPFKDASFEKVVTNCVFEHVLNAFNFLKELSRVIKPDGLIEIVTDNPYHYAWTVLKCGIGGTEQPDLASDHHGIYYPENIRRMFKKLGICETAFSWETKRPWTITFPFAKFLVMVGIWREECLYLRYKIVGRKTSCEF
jgi:SAM-dependent methyltransferase